MRFADLDLTQFSDTTVFLDVDGTIVADRDVEASPAQLERIQTLARTNDVYLCSNRDEARTRQLAAAAGVRALPLLRKPRVHAAVASVSRRTRTLVIGDKFLTDGLFALRIGAEFVKVESLRSGADVPFARFSYALDAFAWRVAPFILIARPLQWVKNLLVFTPAFFAGALFLPGMLEAAGAGFLAFCVAASGVYVFNDLRDIEEDTLHPAKRCRPLAAGHLSVRDAWLFLICLVIVELALLVTFPALIVPIVVYVMLNALYTLSLKRIAVLDVLSVASCYVIRVIAGGVVTSIAPSPWLITCVFFAALFIVIGKRLAEYGNAHKRSVLTGYSERSLEYMLLASMTLALVCYSIYSVLGHQSPLLVYSTVFVVFALFKALNELYVRPSRAESPEVMLLKDPWIFGSFVLWAVYLYLVFYLS